MITALFWAVYAVGNMTYLWFLWRCLSSIEPSRRGWIKDWMLPIALIPIIGCLWDYPICVGLTLAMSRECRAQAIPEPNGLLWAGQLAITLLLIATITLGTDLGLCALSFIAGVGFLGWWCLSLRKARQGICSRPQKACEMDMDRGDREPAQ